MRIPEWYSPRSFYNGDGELRESGKVFLREVLQEQTEYEPEKGCWIFSGGYIAGGGYHQLVWMGQRVQAHRFAYELWRGSIPIGMFILHSCDVPACINPDHLRIGTQRDNMRDKVGRGRHVNTQADKTHCPQGHEYTPENVYLFENRRYCRACHQLYSRRYAKTRDQDVKRRKLKEWRANNREHVNAQARVYQQACRTRKGLAS